MYVQSLRFLTEVSNDSCLHIAGIAVGKVGIAGVLNSKMATLARPTPRTCSCVRNNTVD